MSIASYGGELVYRVLSSEAAEEAAAGAAGLPEVSLRQDSIVDLSNLAYGLFRHHVSSLLAALGPPSRSPRRLP